MNSELIKRMESNKEYSEKLIELLNKLTKNNNIKYSPVWSNDSIGIRQLLSKDELNYKEMFFKDKIKKKLTLDEVIDLIYNALGTGMFTYVCPSNLEKELYEEFNKYKWNISIDKEVICIDGDEIYINDILSKNISKDKIEFDINKLETGYSKVIITKCDKFYDLDYVK